MAGPVARHRTDDDRIVISTDAYVSHKKVRRGGAWVSSFSMTVEEARQLHAELGKLLDE